MPLGSTSTPTGLQPDALHPWPPARGHEEALSSQLRAVVELQDELLTVPHRLGRGDAEMELNAVTTQRLAERLAECGRLADNHTLGRFDQDDLSTEAAHRLGQLDTCRPASEDEEPRRDGLHTRRLAGTPDSVEIAQAGNGWGEGIGTGRDDDVLAGVANAVDFDGTDAGEATRPAQQVDVLAL